MIVAVIVYMPYTFIAAKTLSVIILFNNAAAIAAVLTFGRGDPTKTITAAVSRGWDTDCNGAAVGSVMGTIHGAAQLPQHRTAPLNDTLYSFIPGFYPISVRTCAARSLSV